MKLDRTTIIAIAAAVGLAVVGWYFVVYAPRAAQDVAAVAKADNTIKDAVPDIGKSSMKEVEKYYEKHIEIRDRVAAGQMAIATAEGADTPVPPAVAAAGLRALCMHEVYRVHPRCAEMQRLRPERDVGQDAGRRPSGN